MTDARPAFTVYVTGEDDAARRERLTRALRGHLNDIDGVTAQFAPGGTPPPLAKGGAVDVGLWVFLAGATQAVARVAVEAIRAWCTRERHRTVQLRDGDRTLKITGTPDAAQERAITEFFGGHTSP